LPRIVASCYPYSAFPTTRGWAEKQRLGDLDQYARAAGSDLRQFANFEEEAKILVEGGETARILPSMTSFWLAQTAVEINERVARAEKVIGIAQNKEFISTVTDLKILSNLALFHSRRIPAAVSYNLFLLTNGLPALNDAIRYERLAIEAWKELVAAAGDVYTEDLMMGVREAGWQGIVHHLSGHWKDELGYLEEGLKVLEQKQAEFRDVGSVKLTPHYQPANSANNDKLFKITHQPVTSAAANKPITINIRVSAVSGVKEVRLLYRNVNQEMEYKTLPMLPSGEKEIYHAVVPAEQFNPQWDVMYLVEVIDKNGKGTIYPDFNKETPYCIIKLNRTHHD